VKVILTQDVPKLGHTGDVRKVADGYARNYLIPGALALPATPGVLKELERQRDAESRREERMEARAEALANRLSAVTLTFEAKAGEKGHLYGSITPMDLVDALGREVGEQFDRRKLILEEPIRHVGRYVVAIRLRADVVGQFRVVVKPEGGELPAESPSQDAEATELEDGEALA